MNAAVAASGIDPVSAFYMVTMCVEGSVLGACVGRTHCKCSELWQGSGLWLAYVNVSS